MTDRPVILWVRHVLRLADNPALMAAVESNRPIIPLFVWDQPGQDGEPSCERPLGAAARWWLNRSLRAHATQLESVGSRLIFRSGPAKEVLKRVCADTGADRLFYTISPDPAAARRDHATRSALEQDGLELSGFFSGLLFDPGTIRNQAGQPYKVFTPFWKTLWDHFEPPPPLAEPGLLHPIDQWPESTPLSAIGIDDMPAGRSKLLEETWTTGARAASIKLTNFMSDGLENYSSQRDFLARASTSQLSPYLRFGEVSPRTIWHLARTKLVEDLHLSASGLSFLRQLTWREFAYDTLQQFPGLATTPINAAFKKFPWQKNDEHLEAWHAGRTGYPVVDAAMRQLESTGWVHNRARMIAGSFLAKHLLQSWQSGESWYWDNLVDADPANNPFGWQWIAGCGADASPYFRIFNPILQGRKFDRTGTYVRHWIPALSAAPNSLIHEPWKLSPCERENAGLDSFGRYPDPIVDHRKARQRALAAFERTKH